MLTLSIKLSSLSELIKTTVAYALVHVAMCDGESSGLCAISVVVSLLQIGASGSFYFVGHCKGQVFKPWRRESDRNLIPLHVTFLVTAFLSLR